MFYHVMIFILFSLFGFLHETIIGKSNSVCGDSLVQRLGLCYPLLTVYGFGAIILLILRDYVFVGMNILPLSVLASVIITGFECIVGHISFMHNGKQTWKYDSHLCNGYISPWVTLGWFAYIVIFYGFGI